MGTTTIAINAAIALHRELGRKVCLVDGNLQFGDHRVFLDLGLDRKSIVDIVTAPVDRRRTSSARSSSSTTRASTCCSRRRRRRPPSSSARSTCRSILEQLAAMYDYVLVDIDKRLDDVNLGDLRGRPRPSSS